MLAATRSTLVVIDYAETRRELPRIVAAAAARKPELEGKLRIALVAREIGDWWHLLLGASAPIVDLLRAYEPLELRPETVSVEQRQQVFERSVRDFAAVLGKRAHPRVPDLSNPRFGRMLYLGMAALAALEGSTHRTEELLRDTLEHEKRYIKLYYFTDQAPDLLDQADFLDRVMRLLAAATLRGMLLTRDETELVSRRIRGPDEARQQHIFRFLNGLYAGPSSEAAGTSDVPPYLTALEPDLLGQELVAEVLGDEETPSDYLSRVFEDATERAVRHGFIILGRLGARSADERYRRWIAAVLNPDVCGRALPAIDAALTLAEETAHTPLGQVLHLALVREGSAELAREILPRIPERTVALREVGAWAAERSLAAIPSDGVEDRARILTILGNRLSDIGKRDEALAITEEAVRNYRALADTRAGFLPDLALGLVNLGARLSEAGKHEDALATAREAASRYRTLADASPGSFLSDFATSLHNLGVLFSRAGKHEEALTATEEAVRNRRVLAAARPDRSLPNLASSLGNLGVLLGATGKAEEALVATEEAVRHWRTLAAGRPDAFLPDLASSLDKLGNALSALRRYVDALAAMKEAVRHYRELAATRPMAFLSDLAGSLHNLSIQLIRLDKHKDALATSEEAVRHYRTLAISHPDIFVPGLATSLIILGATFSGLGRREDALATSGEAVRHYRLLAAAHPDVFLPNLAASLHNLGGTLRDLDRLEDALKASEEAVIHFRTLAAARSEVFVSDLIASLGGRGASLSRLGRHEDALATREEALAVVEGIVRRNLPLARANPAVFAARLSRHTDILRQQLIDLGREPNSSTLFSEARGLLYLLGM